MNQLINYHLKRLSKQILNHLAKTPYIKIEFLRKVVFFAAFCKLLLFEKLGESRFKPAAFSHNRAYLMCDALYIKGLNPPSQWRISKKHLYLLTVYPERRRDWTL